MLIGTSHLTSLTYYYSYICRTHTIICSYCQMNRYLVAMQSLCLGELGSLIAVYNVWRNPLWKILKNGSWHTKIFKQKKLIIQLQVFYKHVEVTLLFPLRINFPHPKYFFLCVFPGIFFEVTPVQYFPSS